MKIPTTLYLTTIAMALCVTILSENVLARYIDGDIDIETRDSEQVPAYNSVDHDTSAYLAQEPEFTEEDYRHLANLLVPQKRMLCRKYFIYNPVQGKCTPTLMAFKAMRTKSQRSFPNPQAWAKLW